ncbi:putative basic proline-rich protein-like [Iris pallida]|uniref:Basic proline-rich protein-like n=1 Tax=Iris pallida TaxID=29817 RepID=A0AAX6HS44_IRIPA|nr:putative basic proline-rich protein-like [Iris pallida]
MATSTPLPPPPPPSEPSSSWVYLLGGILHESHRVISSHTRHFLALSVLFLLPVSLLLLSFPHLSPSSSPSPPTPPQSLLRLSHPSSALSASLAAAAVVLLSLSASAAVSLSFRRSLFSLPVNLLPLLLSLPLPILRLLLTLLPFLLLFLSLSLLTPFSLPLLLLLPFFLLPFSLSFPIAVLEPSYFFSPLRRSLHLTRGMRLPSLCLLLFFIPASSFLVWAFGLHRSGPVAGWNVARTVFASAALTLLLLYWLTTNAALYVYCKAVHGELAEEVADEFLWEYVSLPSDPDKVPHVVSVVRH